MNIFNAYKYCPLCGGSVTGEKNIRKCSKCNKTRFINPTPATGAIIIKDRKFLLTKRAFEPEIGTWDIPGGFLEPDETFENGITREIHEELGVSTIRIKYFNSAVDHYIYDGIDDSIVVINFLVCLDSYDFKPSDDISEAKFFSIEEMPFREIKFPSVSSTIKDYYSKN